MIGAKTYWSVFGGAFVLFIIGFLIFDYLDIFVKHKDDLPTIIWAALIMIFLVAGIIFISWVYSYFYKEEQKADKKVYK